MIRLVCVLLIILCAEKVESQDLPIVKSLVDQARVGNHHLVIQKADSIIDTTDDYFYKVELLNKKLYSLYVLEQWHDFKICIDRSLGLRNRLGQGEKNFTEEYIQLIWYYQAIAKHDSAIYYGEKSIELLKQHYDRRKLARAYNLLAYSYTNLSSKYKPQSLPYYDSARQVLGTVHGAVDSLILARWYHNMGNQINNTSHDPLLAMPYYDSSLWIYEKYNDPSKVALNSYVKGYLMRRSNNELSRDHFSNSLNTITSDSQKYNDRLLLIILPRLAFSNYLMFEKSNILSDLIRAYELHKQYDQLLKNVNVSSIEDMIFFNTYDLNTYSRIVALAYEIDSIKGDSDYVLDALPYVKNSKYYLMNETREGKRNTGRNETDLSSKLSPGECMLDYYFSMGKVYCAYSTSDETKLVNLGSTDELKATMDTLQSALPPTVYEQYAHLLYEQLIGQLPIDHTSISKFIVIRDIYLNNLPFEQLVVTPNGQSDYRRMDYLMNHYDIAYHLSVVNYFENQSDQSAINNFSVFNPTYQQQTKIPFSQNMINRMSYKYELYEGSGNSKVEHFMSEARHADVVHISAHAEDVAMENVYVGTNSTLRNFTENFEESGIYFSDRKIKLEEISNMDLSNVNLLVAHGCESNQGKHIRNEGAMSICRAFYEAGVSSVIVAEWKIDDQYSSMILEQFYEGLDEHSKGQAMRLAKLDFVKNAKSSNMAHPHNWAGLVYIGNDGRIELPKRNSFSYAYLLFLFIPLLLTNHRFKFHRLFSKRV